MATWAVRTLRVIIAVALVGSVVVQVALAPLLWVDLEGAPAGVRVPLVVVLVGVVLCLQVVGVCVWRLLSMVRAGTVFSHAAFRWVDATTVAIAVAAALVFGVAVVARFANTSTPGDAVAPGVVGLVSGAALVIAGVAVLMRVMRALLAQAVELDHRARTLQSELDEVI